MLNLTVELQLGCKEKALGMSQIQTPSEAPDLAAGLFVYEDLEYAPRTNAQPFARDRFEAQAAQTP